MAYEITLFCVSVSPNVSRQRLREHVPTRTNTQERIEEQMDAVSSMWSVLDQMLNI
jgi:hypothetical protein